MDDLTDRIWRYPQGCSGRPCIRGTNILVSQIQDLYRDGTSVQRLLERYPQLACEDLLAALQQLPANAAPPTSAGTN
ncbi:MAG: DUF433 domain-containing protein [Acidobacteria bacterium]|nr:DUF433 domain-containing protein [Acidobacteriota bacterium]